MSKEKEHILLQKLDGFIRKYYKNKLVKGIIYTFTIVFLFFLSITILEYFGNFSSKTRAVLFFGFLIVTIATLVNYIIIPLLKLYRLGNFIDHKTAAQIIGVHFGSVKDKLLNTLQLIDESKTSENELIAHSIDQKTNELRVVPFAKAIDISKNKKYLKYAVIPLLVFFGILFVNAKIIKDGTTRIVNYSEEFVPEAPFEFNLVNKNLEVVENEDFELTILLTGSQIPDQVTLKIKNSSIRLRKKSKTEFSYTFKNVQEKKQFKLEALGYSSKDYELKPIIKPVLMGYKLVVDYPNYTSLQDVELENVGSLNVPQGTSIKWVFRTKNTSNVSFSEQGKELTLNKLNKNSYSVKKRINKTSFYSLKISNEHIENVGTQEFEIFTTTDSGPSISAEERKDSLYQSLTYFSGKIADDYGFSKLVFKFRKSSSDSAEKQSFTEVPLDFSQGFNQSSFYHSLNEKDLGLGLGESLEYYFEVWDNDNVNGSKSARTLKRTVKAPTKEELEKSLEEKNQSIKDKLEKNIDKAQKIQQEIKKLTESILNKKNMDWQDKKKMSDLLERQKQLSQQNEEIKKNSQEKSDEENKYQQENESLKKKQEKLEKLMEELNSDEMKKLYEKLEKMMEKMDKSKLQKSLEELDQENIDMKKEMERTLEMFKQMEMDEKLEDFAKKMEELAEKQEKLAEKEESNPEEQEKLNEEFEEAEKQLDELKEKNEELEKKKELNEVEEEKERAKEEMKDSKENLEKNKPGKAKKSQQNAAESMKSAAAKAKEMMSSSASSAQENMEDLRSLLENLIALSFDQEDVLSELKITSANNPKYVKLGQRQVKIKDDAKMIEDSLFALSKRVEQIGPIVNKEINKINDGISLSLSYIGERMTRNATHNQQLTMTSVNNLALLLDEALKQMQEQQANQQPGSGSCNNPGGSKPKPGLLPSLKEAQGKAEKAMGKLKKLGEKGKSKEGKGKNSKELARMAAEQAMLRKAINEIGQELNKDGGGIGNELKKIEKEIEKIEEDIINDNVNKQTVIRQQDVLTRLLKSEKAIRERELDEKRESNSVNSPKISNPNEFLEYKRNKEKKLDQLNTIPPSLKPYYRNKVNDYFDQTN